MDRNVVMACPHCGRTSSYPQRMENGSQVDTCRQCHKSFRIEFRSGELRDVRA